MAENGGQGKAPSREPRATREATTRRLGKKTDETQPKRTDWGKRLGRRGKPPTTAEGGEPKQRPAWRESHASGKEDQAGTT